MGGTISLVGPGLCPSGPSSSPACVTSFKPLNFSELGRQDAQGCCPPMNQSISGMEEQLGSILQAAHVSPPTKKRTLSLPYHKYRDDVLTA